jgi:hypothetical protein
MSRSSTHSDRALRATTASSTRAATSTPAAAGSVHQHLTRCQHTQVHCVCRTTAGCDAPTLQGKQQQFKLPLLQPAKPPPHGRALCVCNTPKQQLGQVQHNHIVLHRARAMPSASPVQDHTWWGLTVMHFAQREETNLGCQQLLLAPANYQPAVLCSESDGPQRRSEDKPAPVCCVPAASLAGQARVHAQTVQNCCTHTHLTSGNVPRLAALRQAWLVADAAATIAQPARAASRNMHWGSKRGRVRRLADCAGCGAAARRYAHKQAGAQRPASAPHSPQDSCRSLNPRVNVFKINVRAHTDDKQSAHSSCTDAAGSHK